MECQSFQLRGGGRLTVQADGPLVCMEVHKDNDARGLYKAWICGQGGKMLLGTLCPDEHGLKLVRRISRRQLERSGCWPVTGGECVLSFSFAEKRTALWRREEHPERLLKDVVLRQELQGKHLLLLQQEQYFCLAAPFDSTRPFPVTSLFCLAKIGRLDGRYHVLFRFDRDGNPLVPHNTGASGENSGIS